MKLPSGGFNQSISGRIGLDVTGFQADARRIGEEAKKSATAVAQAYQTTGRQAALGIQQVSGAAAVQRREMENGARSALQLEKQRQQEQAKSAREAANTARDERKRYEQQVRQMQEQARAVQRLEEQKRREIEKTRKLEERADRDAQRMGMSMVRAETQAHAENVKRQIKPYNDLRVAVGEARTTLLLFTAAAGGLIYAGLQAADTVRMLSIRYRELAGSQAEGDRLMRQIEKTARSLNLPIRGTQEAFLGLIPAVRVINGDLAEFTNVALRLATLNNDSRGGVEGAIYAMREAMSSGNSDLMSLAERFNIPRKILREYIALYGGDLAKALDVVLNMYGATDAAVKENSKSLNVLRQQIMDTATRALERAFTGALTTAQNVLMSFNDLLESTPQWVVELGAAAVIAAGGATALLVATTGLSFAWTQGLTALKAYGAYISSVFIPALGKAAASTKTLALSQGGLKASVGIAALAAGTGIGIGVVNLVGRVTGDERLANFGLDDAIKTLKQGLYLAVSMFIDVIQGIVTAINLAIGFFQRLGSATQDMSLRFAILMAELAIGIQQALGVFGDQGEIGRMQGVRQSAIAELQLLEAQAAESVTQIHNGVAEGFNAMRRNIYNAMFPAEAIVQETTISIKEAFEQLLFDTKRRLYEFYGEQGDIFAETVDNVVRFREELSALFEEGNIDSLESRLRGLERERDAILSIVPELERHAEYSEEAARKLEDYRKRLEEITKQLPQFLDALEAAVSRGITKAVQEMEKALLDAQTKRDTALLKLQESAAVEELKLADQGDKKRKAVRDKTADAEEAYRKAVLKAEETFRKRLADIQRNYIKAVTLAASALDAAGVAAAIQARVEQRREATEQNSEAQRAAAERLTEQRLAALKELEELRLELETRRKEMSDDREARRAAILKEYQNTAALAAAKMNDEIRGIQAYYSQRHADMMAYHQAERALRLQQHSQYLQDLASQVIMPTLQKIMENPLVRGLLSVGSVVAGAVGNNRAGGTGIGQVQFNINGATDPQAVAQAVNMQLMRLAGMR